MRRGSFKPLAHQPRLWRNRRGSVDSFLSIFLNFGVLINLNFGEAGEDQSTLSPIKLEGGKN
jgi:hypothetical protein